MNILVLLSVVLAPFLFIEETNAAAFTQVYVRFDRLKASTATTGLVCADPVTAGTEADVQVTFPTGFTVSETLGDWTVSTSNLPSGATAWPGIGTATAASNTTKIVTFPSTDLTETGTVLYCFNWTNTAALSTSTAANDKSGTVTTRTSGPATIDTNSWATSIISDDQIVVTATVPTLFTFALSGNTDTFTTNLSTSITSTSGRTVTITTNAENGWVAWVKSANAALNSATSSGTITSPGSVDDTPSDLDSVTGYVLDVDKTTDASGGCTLQQNPGYGDEYDGADTTQGGTLSTTFQP
ncbi:MAG: hypothetical protein MN733_28210, partial [Nitrososphaera sp.]|nr:hypothetical protein [Nitrososphaera sp.]